jgi:superfamily II DNA/RNA helicase
MFDAATAQLLRSAPSVPGLDPADIPALLTSHYANLVSARLRGATEETASGADEGWTLERIADTYELITSIHTDAKLRRASAFVAATAQQILARRQAVLEPGDGLYWNVDRGRVDPPLAAAVLFLAAEQYADANEAASAIRPSREGQLYEVTILSECVVDLARGELGQIIERSARWRRPRRGLDLEEQAFAALVETLIAGIEMVAAQFLGLSAAEASPGRFRGPRDAFMRVLELSSAIDGENAADLGGDILNTYPGPYHLASLLLAAYDGISEAALTAVPPPDGADPEFWRKWLRYRAGQFPFLWPNHRDAIAKEFHQTAKSAVVVLPTGAGKTTVSSLKIAGVLARNQKVIFLAPTHALVEQLTDDLQKMFPKDILGSVVSSDFDLLFQAEAQLQEIEVMTPERCLAMLSFAPEAFSDVGLLVFDECHLLSPQSGKIRRALDGMLCVLGFNHIAPDADTLFLSAMLKNGEEFAQWISELTGRASVCVDLLWKPSRQARGVVIYKDKDIDQAKKAALLVQSQEDKKKGKRAKSLRAAASRKLVAQPWAIWGLQHNWLGQGKAHCIMSELLDGTVTLAGDNKYGPIYLTPNANQVAIRLAVAAATNGLKSIVFVNTKNDAISTARDISTQLGEPIHANEAEKERWDALQTELGGLKHAVLPDPAIAVPHNSSMLRLERDLAERMFRRQNGAKVIVATPTLAQGLNLPAHLAILAGDKRADADQGGREDLEAHEILNAAARAGRAGHLANGVVLLIPEPIISFSQGKALDVNVITKLKSVLPEDDRCVVISDPLEIVLDRLMQGEALNSDVRYLINRMAALREAEGFEDPTLLFNLRKSLGAYTAQRRSTEQEFEEKIDRLKKSISDETPAEIDNAIAVLASQSGLSTSLLLRLKKRISDSAGSLPVTVEGWLIWTVEWLVEDHFALESLLYDIKGAVLGACGRRRDSELTPKVLSDLLPGLIAWIQGKPLCVIEMALGGDPNSTSQAMRTCPRARELVSSIIPRGFSFIMGLASHVVAEVDPFDEQEELSRQLVECLGTAVRKGFDSPEKVFFASENPGILSRVQVHQRWAQQHALC